MAPQAEPKSDAYTGMLIISLVALLAGCVFLYLDFSEYSKSKPPAISTSVPRPAPPAGLPAPGQ